MAKIQELYDRTTGEAIYPRTAFGAVCDSEGRDLETRMASIEKDTDDKLADYSTTEEVKGFIEKLVEDTGASLASGDFGASVAGNQGFISKLTEDSYGNPFLSRLVANSTFVRDLALNGTFGYHLSSNTSLVGNYMFGKMLATNSGLSSLAYNTGFIGSLATNSTFCGMLASRLAYDSSMLPLASNDSFTSRLAANSNFAWGLIENRFFITTLAVRQANDSSTRTYWANALATNSPLATGLVYYSGFYNSLATNNNFVSGFYSTLASYGAFLDTLAKKQDVLTLSDDLELTPDGVLSVAERAKREVFDDMWAFAGGTVMSPGELYELNGTTGITYPEAMQIMDCRQQQVLSTTGLKTAFDASVVGVLKAIFPFKIKYQGGTTQFLCSGQKLITKFVWPTNCTTTDAQYMFDGCTALKEIQGTIIFESTCNVGYTFRGCVALEEVSITLRRTGISFADCPKLSINSVRNIKRDANVSAITITVHPDVFAKLTGDTSNAAAAALTEEELAQWAQVLTDALEKNITFTTP